MSEGNHDELLTTLVGSIARARESLLELAERDEIIDPDDLVTIAEALDEPLAAVRAALGEV